MTIVLQILKIVGIILLAVLGFLVLLILLALFVPVRYRARGSYHGGKLDVSVRVSWLLHFLVFAFDLHDESEVYLRIFGIKKKLAKADNATDFEENIEETADADAKDVAEDVKGAAEKFVETSVRQREKKENTAEARAGDKEQGTAEARAGDKAKKNPLARLMDKLRELWRRFLAAVRKFTATAARMKRLVTDEHNQAAVRFLLGRVVLLLKKIMPKKLSLDLTYSTGSPDTTGEVLGVFAMFPIGYRNRWHITPDFTADSFYAEVDFDVSGRFFFYQILGIIISVLMNQDCRDLYKKLQNKA